MKTRTWWIRRRKAGFSLLELLAIVTILGIVAVVVIPRITVPEGTTRANADLQNKAEINSAIERWYLENGDWPADLDELGNDRNYFPDGLPKNPIDNSAYEVDTTTKRVK